jgi:hypothetical protein
MLLLGAAKSKARSVGRTNRALEATSRASHLDDGGHSGPLVGVWLQARQRQEGHSLQVLGGEAAQQLGVGHFGEDALLVVQDRRSLETREDTGDERGQRLRQQERDRERAKMLTAEWKSKDLRLSEAAENEQPIATSKLEGFAGRLFRAVTSGKRGSNR